MKCISKVKPDIDNFRRFAAQMTLHSVMWGNYDIVVDEIETGSIKANEQYFDVELDFGLRKENRYVDVLGLIILNNDSYLADYLVENKLTVVTPEHIEYAETISLYNKINFKFTENRRIRGCTI